MQNINIHLIKPHPQNPRKDLGDLIELTESIKSQGILQNLTVHDNEDGTYTAIIGHRRLVAAKEAGLVEVPCSVVSMDEKTQLSTMLLENMQRSDLTIYEQAKGMQLCLDFGMDEKELSNKTGFSKTTITRRLNMLKYDEKKVQDSVARGATLQDYIELEKIKNDEIKNNLVTYLGTKDFDYRLSEALRKEKRDKMVAEWVAILETFAERTEAHYPDGYIHVVQYYTSTDKVKIPDDLETRKYKYNIASWGSVTLYGQKIEFDNEKKQTIIIKDSKEEKREAIKAQFEVALETRKSFMKEFVKKSKQYETEIVQFAGYTFAIMDYWGVSGIGNLFNEITGLEICDSNNDNFVPQMKEAFKKNTTPRLAAIIYSILEDTSSLPNCYNYYDGSFNEKDDELKIVYEFLTTIGYQISDIEQKLLDGSHELYQKAV